MNKLNEFSFKKKIAIACILSILLSMSQISYAEYISIRSEGVSVHVGPGIQYKIKYIVNDGFPLFHLESKGDWLLCKDFENTEGWVHKSQIKTERFVIVTTMTTTNALANIYESPNQQSTIVAKVTKTATLRLLKEDKDWIHIQHGSGISGWVNKQFVWGF